MKCVERQSIPLSITVSIQNPTLIMFSPFSIRHPPSYSLFQANDQQSNVAAEHEGPRHKKAFQKAALYTTVLGIF